jgi:hypothetical protein
VEKPACAGPLFKDGRVLQPPAGGHVEQLLVGHAAPQKERQPRRELEVAEAIGGPRRRVRRVALEANQKVWIGEDSFQPELQARVESAITPAVRVKTEERPDFPIGDRPAIGAARDRRENPPGARQFLGRDCGSAGEDRAAARRIARTLDGVRAIDRHAVDRRVPFEHLIALLQTPT